MTSVMPVHSYAYQDNNSDSFLLCLQHRYCSAGPRWLNCSAITAKSCLHSFHFCCFCHQQPSHCNLISMLKSIDNRRKRWHLWPHCLLDEYLPGKKLMLHTMTEAYVTSRLQSCSIKPSLNISWVIRHQAGPMLTSWQWHNKWQLSGWHTQPTHQFCSHSIGYRSSNGICSSWQFWSTSAATWRAPAYLADDCQWNCHHHLGLRASLSTMKLEVPSTRTWWLGDWNWWAPVAWSAHQQCP